MPKSSTKRYLPNPALLQESVQQTMQRMSEHFAATGAFRGQDVARVIGSPAETITQVADTDLAEPRPSTSNAFWFMPEGVRS